MGQGVGQRTPATGLVPGWRQFLGFAVPQTPSVGRHASAQLRPSCPAPAPPPLCSTPLPTSELHSEGRGALALVSVAAMRSLTRRLANGTASWEGAFAEGHPLPTERLIDKVRVLCVDTGKPSAPCAPLPAKLSPGVGKQAPAGPVKPQHMLQPYLTPHVRLMPPLLQLVRLSVDTPSDAASYRFAVEAPCPQLEQGFRPAYGHPLHTLPHVPLGLQVRCWTLQEYAYVFRPAGGQVLPQPLAFC